jgi:ferric-dicitrate binding protein FerR (iron transport regulator)
VNDPASQSDLTRLVEALVSGTITPEQHAELDRALATGSAARDTYFQYIDLHLALQTLHGRVHNDLSSILALPVRPSSRSRAWRYAVAASVLLLLLAGLAQFWSRRGPAPDPPIATLAEQAGAKFHGAVSALATGSRLRPGDTYALTDGIVRLAFSSGAEAIIEAPAVFEVTGPMRMVMRTGKCSVHAEGEAVGFVVDTPATRITDRGTRFSVEVSETGEALVQVTEGRTEVASHLPGAAVDDLIGGMARRYPAVPAEQSVQTAFHPARYTGRLPDRVVAYRTTRGARGGASDLIDLTVQRDGRATTYRLDQLTVGRLIHFKGADSRFHMTTLWSAQDPYVQGRKRDELLSSPNLNDGIINPGGAVRPLTSDPHFHQPEHEDRPNTPGFAVRFEPPVINGPGPDVVLFELQVVIHPEGGDAFHVSPLQFAPGLRSRTVERFDIQLSSPGAMMLEGYRLYTFQSTVDSLAGLQTTPHNGGPIYAVPSKLLAVGIDLSDLGYEPATAVQGLFFQDALDDVNYLDPVLIVGLPEREPQ